MAQTLVSLMVHVIFSTKNREALITPEIAPELFAYIGGILRNNDSRLIDAGGTPIMSTCSFPNQKTLHSVR
jgi:hypothetical protein